MANVNQVKNQVATRNIRPMSPAVAEVRTNINLMVEVMKSCMVKDMHFGIIPGVQKPSLFKAGAEKIMATFRLSADPVVEDLSKDGEIRFRVRVEIKAKDGSFVGAGIGECSSQEEKYMWRSSVCDKEFDITPEYRRRIKFKKSYGKIEEIAQVRCNPSDLANTILKMAKKRALVDGVLTATGASDLFSQDIEDLPAEYVDTIAKHDAHVSAPEQQAPTPVATTDPVEEEKKDHTPKTASKLCDVVIGSSLLEFKALINSVSSRKTKTGKDISAYAVEDSDGSSYVIEKFGTPKEGAEGALATFFEIKVSEFQGNRQYLAKDVILDQ